VPRPLVLGLAGVAPNPDERRFFAEADPFGFILFQRNCREPVQVAELVRELRASVGRDDAPVLIDQEGGRVARLKPPHWRAAPSAARFGALAEVDLDKAIEATRLNAALIAAELSALGIDVDCLPVLDLPATDADPIIGDRAFAADPAMVATLGRACCEGLFAGGVTPIVKHMPGHGRATVDSHESLPVVDADLATLRAADFAPFRSLSDMPWAMTAHVVYTAIDPERPATMSPAVVGDVIRGWIGFKGVLLTDDLSMGALSGAMGDRGRDALAAGCDLALHCNGRMDEMEALVEALPPMRDEVFARMRSSLVRDAISGFDTAAASSRLDALLSEAPVV